MTLSPSSPSPTWKLWLFALLAPVIATAAATGMFSYHSNAATYETIPESLISTSTQFLPSSMTPLLPILLIVLLSSLSYYLIAALLSLSPPTSGLGLILLRRVHHAKLNWHEHIIRSFLEMGFWVSVIGLTYLSGGSGAGAGAGASVDGNCSATNLDQGDDIDGFHDTCNFQDGISKSIGNDSNDDWYLGKILDRQCLEALLWGTLSGVGVVLLGDVWTRYLKLRLHNVFSNWEVRLRYHNQNSEKSQRQKYYKLDEHDDDSEHNTTSASLGAFTVLYTFSFFGYHTLHFIFSFPSLFTISFLPHISILLLHILLATLAGLTFIATASILIRISSTEKVGTLLLKRVTHAKDNWRRFPKRSMQELGGWLVVVIGSFHCKYYGSGKCATGVMSEVFDGHCVNALSALVLALQWGTLVGCVLAMWNGEELSGEEPYVRAVKQRASKDVASSTELKQNDIKESSAASPPPSMTKCAVREKARKEGLVLYDGNWYNVGKFVPHHPGGEEILKQYLGADISFVFRVMHRDPQKIMKYRKPSRAATSDEIKALANRRNEICKEMVTDYENNLVKSSKANPSFKVDSTKFNMEEFEKDASVLYQQFLDEGFFKPTLPWLVGKSSLTLLFLLLAIVSMRTLPSIPLFQSSPLLYNISLAIPGVFLGLFWQQSGYMMHDAEHHNLVGNECCNDILGWMFGTVFVGVNGAWWREEHREHHALLLTFDDRGCRDPQFKEDVWIQNKKIIQFFGDQIIHFLTNFQHILFVGIVLFVGRFGIMIDSTVTERKFRPWTILGNVLHIVLHYFILSQTNHPIRVYMIAAIWFSILSLQLMGNHFVKPWHLASVATEASYCFWQILCTQDFSCPNWLRWFYGGLNFHYSHHLFPTLSREYFHITSPRIKKLCEKHGLPYIEVGFFECVFEMVQKLHEVTTDFPDCGHGAVTLFSEGVWKPRKSS